MTDDTGLDQTPTVGMSPTMECDIIMKGGVTSGIVYPSVVYSLVHTFRFRSIGGASAGAIAAAVTAAAELGRFSPKGGFSYLKQITDKLAEASEKENEKSPANLFYLFQPAPPTKALFNLVVSFVSEAKGWRKKVRVYWTGIRSFKLAALVGFIPGLLMAVFCALASVGFGVHALGYFVATLLLLCLPLITIPLWIAFVARKAVEENWYGLCSGYSGDKNAKTKPLTAWLDRELELLAGRNPEDKEPLTFRHLENHQKPIELRLMTTCITQGRPYTLPFKDTHFYFKPTELRQFFPERIVSWMENNQRKPSNGKAPKDPQSDPLDPEKSEEDELEANDSADIRTAEEIESDLPEEKSDQDESEYCRFPEPEDIPIVVATRFSLSFPVLLSGMKLYVRDHQDKKRLKPCWFSDGGICSNFPVHFFDSPLPTRPTFAVNLRPYHINFPGADVYMPKDNQAGQLQWINDFEGGSMSILGFLGAIFDSMGSWVDNTQLRMPGYRDRIVAIHLRPNEGGLNLAMPGSIVQKLKERGEKAANELLIRYGTNVDPNMKINWENHKWVRYRSMIALLEKLTKDFSSAYLFPLCGSSYNTLLGLKKKDLPSYREWKPGQRKKAKDATDALVKTGYDAITPGQESDFEFGAPNPRPILRVSPDL